MTVTTVISAAQMRRAAPLTDTARGSTNSSRPVASDSTPEKGTVDKSKANTKRNLAQGKGRDAVRTVTSYFAKPGVECIFEAHRWVNAMDSEEGCGNW
jgi:hypothetical protein